MKALLFALLGSLAITASAYAGSMSCKDTTCGPVVDKCQCADRYYDNNRCMSACEYCQAFGNIGGLDRYP